MSPQPRGSDDQDWFAEESTMPSDVESTGPVLPDFDGTGPIARVTGPVPRTTDDDGAAKDASIMRSSVIMAAGTIVSRITGVLRDTALTAALGLTIVRDAFALGNSLPNVIYILIVGGALNAVFVPQLVRRMKDDADGGRAYGNSLLTATGSVLLVLSLMSVLLAPWIVSLYSTPSYTEEQTALAVAFARYCLPQIFFYGAFAMVSQVLNARGRFGAPMFAPIVNNIVAIATYVGFIVIAGTSAAESGTLTSAQTAWLGIGTTLGVALQALVLFPVMMRSGYRYVPSWRWRGLGLTKAVRLAVWTIGLVLANQIGFLVITRLATEANVNALAAGKPAAGLATYQTGYLIFILPHSVIAVSIVTALLPSLSRTVHSGRLKEAGKEVSRAARIIVMLVAPVAVALFLVAGPVASILFGYGAADADQISQLGTVTQIFALAIMPFTVYYVLLRGWYAQEDTRTPFYLALVLNVINVAAALVLFGMADAGAQQIYALALAFVISYWIILVIAWPILSRRFSGMQTGATITAFLKVFLASLAGLGGGLLIRPLTQYEAGGSKASAALDAVAVSGTVLVAYVLAVWLLRIAEGRDLWAMGAGLIKRR